MTSDHSHDNFRDAAGKRYSGIALVFFIFLPLLPAVLAVFNLLTQ